MKQVASKEAKNRFGELLDIAQIAPVHITKKGRAVGVLMSVRHYERLRGAAWECLTETMDAMGDEAARNSLTKSSLNALFENES